MRNNLPYIRTIGILITVLLFGTVTWNGIYHQKFNAVDSTKPAVPPADSPIPSPTVTLTHLDVPDNTRWFEIAPKCQALSQNVRIFFPVGWKVGGAQHITDNIPGEPGSKEYEDSMKLVTECQIIAGYKTVPGGAQDPCLKDEYGIISVLAWNVPTSTTLDSIIKKFNDDKSKGYVSTASTIEKISNNGRTYVVEKDPHNPTYARYSMLHDNVQISVQNGTCYTTRPNDQDAYFIQTGFEVFQRLLFN